MMSCNAVLLAFAALCLRQGYALKCYQCTSATNPDCSDPIKSSVMPTECTPQTVKDITGGLGKLADSINEMAGKVGFDLNVGLPDPNAAYTCVKAVKQEGDKSLVVRSCSVMDNDKFDLCKVVRAQAGGLVTYCEPCAGDACNAATPATHGPAPALALLPLVGLVVAALARH